MKKLLALATLFCTIAILVGCSPNEESAPKLETQQYTAYGRYYTDIEIADDIYIEGIITDDGNVWSFSTDTISDRTPYDGMPIWIAFDDNGTPKDATDDIVLGVVYDRNTAIYDDLESALEDKFQLERDGNNIHIGGIK